SLAINAQYPGNLTMGISGVEATLAASSVVPTNFLSTLFGSSGTAIASAVTAGDVVAGVPTPTAPPIPTTLPPIVPSSTATQIANAKILLTSLRTNAELLVSPGSNQTGFLQQQAS